MALFLLLVGAVLIVAGTALVYWPAAVVVAGVFCVVGGLLIDLEDET